MKYLALLALACGFSTAWSEPAPTARCFLTSKDSSDRLTEKARLSARALPQPAESGYTVMLDPARRFQEIQGIGGAITDSAAETYYKLPEEQRRKVLNAYFDPQEGIGYSLARTHIHSCDFSSSSYTYVKDDDAALESFSVEPDRKFRIPLIREALAINPQMKLFASPWSPPAWMKDNRNMLRGGKLRPEHRQTWADYYVKFFQAYQAEGIRFWGLTVQNEPMAPQSWESCLFTGEEERDFVRDHLGPTLWKSGYRDLRLMIWDHNRSLAYQRGAAVLSDPEAARYVWGTAFHWYVGDMYESLSRLHDAFPDKAIFFSEGCNGPFDWARFDDWSYGESYGRSMVHDFNHWAAGWTDWNILLDERGGPNHVNNFCFAPIHGDTRKGTLHFQNSYYYIGHFSKFVKPGDHRIACTTTSTELEATAFVNAEGQTVTVALNRTDKPMDARIWQRGRALEVRLPAHSIATILWEEAL